MTEQTGGPQPQQGQAAAGPAPGGNGQPPAAGFDFAQLYRDHPLPVLTEVNGMTLPQALAWYHRNGYHVRPVEIGADGTRRLAGLGAGYSFSELPRPSDDE